MTQKLTAIAVVLDPLIPPNTRKKRSSHVRPGAKLTHVKPIIEYAVSVWAPHTRCAINTLESVHETCCT